MARWQAGDGKAADELFRRYANRLIALARSRLSSKLAGRIDPEDLVQSAYRSFFARARDGQYDIERGGDLWQLLVTITLCKLRNQVKHHTAGKRNVHLEQCFSSEDSLYGLQANLFADTPSPMAAVALVEEVESVMQQLVAVERRILELRLQGHTQYEIAAQTGKSVAGVCRVLAWIKELLEQAWAPK
ncbi:MAG: sigma-70 family RNA polymerase sigma factor [Planctomycetia bacterium]|nr:sigma-70 family RNA polymerase sigma factor [Planctomycetia bacterium]